MYSDKAKEKKWHKEYRDTHKDYFREYGKEYRLKNKNKLKQYSIEYRINNKTEIRERNREYQRKNRLKVKRWQTNFKKRRLDAWSKIIPKQANCGICGKLIKFNSTNLSELIHFDHKYEGIEAIKVNPREWLLGNECNAKNIEIWKSCNFGVLCNKCNPHLPTVNRIDWLEKALKYAKQSYVSDVKKL